MDSPTRYAGVDWASRAHAVCIVDDHGAATERFAVEHTEPDLRSLGRQLAKAGVNRVAIERPDGPVIDALFAAGLEVVVIASRHVKALRTRYGTAGNKDDRSDAFILADVLRTDGQRLRSLRPDAPETVTLRATVRARKDLVQTRTRLTQQLRAQLELTERIDVLGVTDYTFTLTAYAKARGCDAAVGAGDVVVSNGQSGRGERS